MVVPVTAILPGISSNMFPLKDQHEIVAVVPLDPLVPLDPDVPLVPDLPLVPLVPAIDTFPRQIVELIIGVMVLLGWVDDKKLT